MIADKTRYEELRADTVRLGQRKGVINEEGISDRLVDNAVQDMGQQLSLLPAKLAYTQ